MMKESMGEGKIRKRTGSATVMALIFMLFLSIAGGAWVMMLAYENGTSTTDDQEQIAYYAAEAGLKRAKRQLQYVELTDPTAKEADANTEWTWLSEDKNIDNPERYLEVSNGNFNETGKSENGEDIPRYGVYIEYPNYDYKEGEDNPYSVEKEGMLKLPKDKEDPVYTIYSVGMYKDIRKVLSENVTITIPIKALTLLEELIAPAREWADGKTEDEYNVKSGNDYMEAQKDFNQNSGVIQAVDMDTLRKLFGPDITLSNNYVNYDGASTDGTLYIKSATAFLFDGTMADIQMLTYTTDHTEGTYSNRNYATAAFIVKGVLYAYIPNNFLTINADWLGNGTAKFPDGESAKYAATAIQHLKSDYAKKYGWDQYEDESTKYDKEYDWFISALTTAGYTKIETN